MKLTALVLICAPVVCGAQASPRVPPADRVYRDLRASLADSAHGPLGPNWVDVLIFQVARREAEHLRRPQSDPQQQNH